MVLAPRGAAGDRQAARFETPRTKITRRRKVEVMATQGWRDIPIQVLRSLLENPREARMCMKTQPLSCESGSLQ